MAAFAFSVAFVCAFFAASSRFSAASIAFCRAAFCARVVALTFRAAFRAASAASRVLVALSCA